MAKLLRLKQGDECYVPVTIKRNGTAVDISDVVGVEFMIGPRIRKDYPGADVQVADGIFYVQLHQEETLNLPAGRRIPVDGRVQFADGSVLGGTSITVLEIMGAESGKELNYG